MGNLVSRHRIRTTGIVASVTIGLIALLVGGIALGGFAAPRILPHSHAAQLMPITPSTLSCQTARDAIVQYYFIGYMVSYSPGPDDSCKLHEPVTDSDIYLRIIRQSSTASPVSIFTSSAPDSSICAAPTTSAAIVDSKPKYSYICDMPDNGSRSGQALAFVTSDGHYYAALRVQSSGDTDNSAINMAQTLASYLTK